MRLGWFSPFPPVRTGIAACSAELVEALRRRGHDIDLYPEAAAHDFIWRHRRDPYDLVVYQFGNSSHHDYEWAYALKYPGLAVLHDTHLHHARAAHLLREHRAADYRAEFRFNHPDVPPGLAELAVAGLDSRLFYEWGFARGLVESSRLVAVHGDGARRELIESMPNAAIPHLRQGYGGQANSQLTPNAQGRRNSQAEVNSQADLCEKIVSIRLGHGQVVTPAEETEARKSVRARYGIAEDAVLFGVFGGLTPEKRVPQILAAFRSLLPYAPGARLLLAGAPAAYYDIAGDIARHGLADHVTLTGYLDTDDSLTDHLASCDVTLNLRWPTARETSGPWLRALAAGKATVITDLAHLGDVPSLDPRSWTVNEAGDRGPGIGDQGSGIGDQGSGIGKGHEGSASPLSARSPIPDPRSPICVAIDILDEDHSLRLAMRRLAADAALRAQLGREGRDWWVREHSVEVMVEDYERVMREAAARPDPRVDLPAHMRQAGDRKLETLMTPFGIDVLARRSPLGGP